MKGIMQIFYCKNCHKKTKLESFKNKLLFCKRAPCILDRKKQAYANRVTPRQDVHSLKERIVSGIACSKCGKDTGKNKRVCPKCLRHVTEGITI